MSFLALALFSAHQVLMVAVLALGFGFVIFFHELGHFLAAKWVGIKVEQFAVGFGHAIVSWRKGVGFRMGNTQKEYRQRLDEYFARNSKSQGPRSLDAATGEEMMQAEKELGLGETEYRLNWIPLGGYVKMMGQDDLNPNAKVEDPRSYNKKSIGARMVVVSAGVIMNVILAGIGFMILFMPKVGFHVPPAQVGALSSGSPAQLATTPAGKHAPLQPGDQILDYGGRPQEDFTKIGLWVALSADGTAEPIKVRHVDGTEQTLLITPRADDLNGFLSIGIRAPQELRGISAADLDPETRDSLDHADQLDPEVKAVRPGETVVKIDGKDVDYQHYWVLNDALQNAEGHAVRLTVRDDATGKLDATRKVQPHYSMPFGGGEISFAGMSPRASIQQVMPDSPARGKIMPGDVVLSVSVQTAGTGSDTRQNPSQEQLRKALKDAAANSRPVTLVLERNGRTLAPLTLSPTARIQNAKGQASKGLGVGLGYDEFHAVVGQVQPNSPAGAIPPGVTITEVGDHKVKTWFDVQRYLGDAKPNTPIAVQFTSEAGQKHKDVVLTEDQAFLVKNLRRGNDALLLHEYVYVRHASNPIQAASWGVTETRDFILQFYLTLRRMVGGSVSPDQLMGPVGIFYGGAKFAFKGWDWLLWFLAMISANLAVVNFLPIPIVDGGLFTFLIVEKIQGRPLSQRTQAIAQYVGLAFLAGVFLFVTYHDILRFFV